MNELLFASIFTKSNKLNSIERRGQATGPTGLSNLPPGKTFTCDLWKSGTIQKRIRLHVQHGPCEAGAVPSNGESSVRSLLAGSGVPMADSLIKFHPICFSHFKIPFFVGDAVQLGVYTGGPLHDFKISDGVLLKMSECKSQKSDSFKKYRSRCMKINRHYGSGSPVCQFDKGAVVMQEIEGRFYLLGLSSYAISCAAPRVFYDVNWAFEWISVLSTLLATE
ncbi:uncharacterized protein CEXT_806761 [Caerostris extrusa]|uniref:Peptidase S1 domain-containing protein n=1 Tax=Caerostris extrusa TaxID=172846 RepID=A0AAV4Q613_CAEEX|nr:uncharacterized protein CEXT_806761 [Caerostris extrusa]